MQLEELSQKLQAVVSQFDVVIQSVKWSKLGHQKALEINVYHPEKHVDLELISQLSEPINNWIDQYADFDFEYILDIGSVGALRPIETDEDFRNAVDHYIHVYLNSPVEKSSELEGVLKAANESTIHLLINLKGRMKTVEILKTNINKVHYEVKL